MYLSLYIYIYSICIYIYVYVPGTQMTSTFEGQPPPPKKKTCFQSKQGSSKGSRSTYSFVHKYQQLVGGFNPSEKIWVKMGLFPNFRGENEKKIKPPPR